MAEHESTFSHVDRGSDTFGTTAHLFVALECDRPLEPPVRCALAGLDEVMLGRGRSRTIERSLASRPRKLELRLPDGWLSSSHARLVRLRSRWILEDLGSKNGTMVNGRPGKRVALADGDLIEVGHVIFLYRELTAGVALPDEQTADALPSPLPELRTFSAPLAEQLDALAKVAPRPEVGVMVLGESGTGKERIARACHQLSGRPGPFLPVNCGSLPQTLFEAELFGHKKGAFTGATEDRPGLVRSADGGTLFLDEIGDLSMASQTAMLRVLQEREVMPLGSTRPVKVDLRLVTATHRDLEKLVAQKEFRGDLMARLAGLKIVLPPLRQRREDLGILIGTFLRALAREPAKVTFTPRAARALFSYEFPLNIRELEKGLGAALALAGDGQVDTSHLPEALRALSSSRPVDVIPAELTEEDKERRQQLVTLLDEHEGNVARVAKAMGKAPMQIHRWARKYALEIDAFRKTR